MHAYLYVTIKKRKENDQLITSAAFLGSDDGFAVIFLN